MMFRKYKLTRIPLRWVVDKNLKVFIRGALSREHVRNLLSFTDWAPADRFELHVGVLGSKLVDRFRLIFYNCVLFFVDLAENRQDARQHYDHFANISNVARLVLICEVAVLGAKLRHFESRKFSKVLAVVIKDELLIVFDRS